MPLLRALSTLLAAAALGAAALAAQAPASAPPAPAPASRAPEYVPAATPLDQVEERWGIRILGIRLTAGGYMLDFRYHVVDPEKAKPIFVRGIKPYLDDEASGSRFIVPAPPKTGPLRSSNPPQKGRNYFMFFANPARFVKPGNAVTVTVGDFRVEHVRVMAESEPFPETPRFDPSTVRATHETPGGSQAPAGAAAGESPVGAQETDDTQATMGRARPVKVTVPEVTLTDQDGAQMKVAELLAGDAPVILTFMYTSCTTSCPVMAATVAQAQRDLGAEADRIRFVSISIDPEYDTPERMRTFLATYSAGPRWRFLTGTMEQSQAVQRAFDVFRGNKKAHPPGYFIRDARSGAWWRIGGLGSAQVLAGEYRRLAGPGK